MEITQLGLADLEDEGFDVRSDYSGRGMFGWECFGIVGNAADLVRFIRYVVESAADTETNHVLTGGDRDTNWLDNVRTDSMGMDMIYYWPRVTVAKGDEGDGTS